MMTKQTVAPAIKKTDANQTEIVKALRDAGASVVDLHEVGKGCPDILVGMNGKSVLMEIKVEGAKLNKREEEFFKSWKGLAVVVYSVSDALFQLSLIRYW